MPPKQKRDGYRTMTSKYSSKIDTWLAVLLGVGIVVLLATSAAVLFVDIPLWSIILQVVLYLALALLIV